MDPVPNPGTTAVWPDIPFGAWRETRAELHHYTQIVGKYRLVRTDRAIAVGPMSVADFHEQLLDLIRALGGTPELHGRPNEIADPIRSRRIGCNGPTTRKPWRFSFALKRSVTEVISGLTEREQRGNGGAHACRRGARRIPCELRRVWPSVDATLCTARLVPYRCRPQAKATLFSSMLGLGSDSL
jgi:hypothetical protein